MKSKYLASAALCIAAATGFMACGDDVITVYGDEVYSIVDDINDSACTSANDGKMSLEKKSGTLFLCEDGKWTPVNGSEVVDLRCKSSMLKDSIGYNIICDGDTIATIYNGQNGTGSNGSNGLDNYQLAHQAGLIDSTKVTREQWLKSLQGKDADAFLKELLGNKQIPDTVTTIDKLLQYLKGEKGSDGSNGSNGSNGLDSYQLAHQARLIDSTKVTREQWLKSLQGSNGSAGSNGLDSYQLAHQAGLIDSTKVTREQWLKSLQGKDANSDAIEKNLADKLACKVVNTVTDQEEGFMHVTVQCGDDEANQSTLDLPIYKVDDKLLENLAKHYTKHVVVRLPVMSEKLTDSDIYEEIWSRLKSDNHTELMVMDLDEKLNATGKMFMSDLFADVTKKGAFVTVEETNERAVKYKVVRLEGDIDLTNLENSLVQLRIKMNLTNTNGGFTFGGNGSSSTEVIYNAITDLSDESETVVIDFLTDYKAERVKYLVQKNGEKFAEASVDANAQLAAALSLVKDPSELAAFEHYLPGSEGVGLNEYFNSVVWVMALIDQGSKVPDFNKIYNEYREVFAEQGSFNKAIETTYNGIEQSLFFVDYLALLINANFYKWSCQHSDDYSWGKDCEAKSYTNDQDDIYYKIVQNGLVSTYGLDVDKAEPYGEGYKLQKYEFEYGYFHYFVYDEAEKIWYPLEDIATIIKLEGAGDCDADKAAAHTTVHFRKDGVDKTYECEKIDDGFEWVLDENVCNGREEGDVVAYYNNNDKPVSTTCKNQCYDSDGRPTSENTDNCEIVPDDPDYTGEQVGNAQNGKYIDEILNPAEGEGPLGKCGNAENPVGTIKSFDEMDAERSTTTGHADYICNGKKWVKASPVDSYCVGDKVQPTEQKIADENLADMDMQYDQKCEYDGETYVRKNSNGVVGDWLDPTGYIREVYGVFTPRSGVRSIGSPVGSGELLVVAAKTIRDSLYVYMNGYKENAIYKCIDGECSELSDDNAITKFVDQFRDENGGKEYFTSTDSLSIFCNKAEYKKAASGYVAGIAYEVELGNAATGKTKYIASVLRNDWREFTLDEAFGTCDADKMAAQTKLSKLGSNYYKCDCEGEPLRSTAIMYSGCAWIQATELEVTLDAAKNAPCTAKLVHEEDGWTFSKNNLYYCGQKGIENTNDHEHNWLNMTSYLWCSVKSKPLAGHENCTGGYEACSICNDIPEGVEESGTTFIYRANSAATETVTAETYFGVDCSQEPKFIGNLESYEKGWYEFSDDVYMYKADNSLVHDFICKNGHVAEAADANEACNATFEKTEICTYMNEQYEHNGSGWVKMNCSTLHDLENRKQKRDFVCTASDGSEYFKAESWTDDYRLDPADNSSSRYNDKWYDVSDYCATKGDHCYKEGQEPQGESSSLICEFVRQHMEKEVFYCDQTDGVWKKDLVTTAEDYCNRKLKMEYGIQSCEDATTETVGDAIYSCEPPLGLTAMEGCEVGQGYQCKNIESDSYSWMCSDIR